MKHIFLNLKRFDIPKEKGGVNSITPIREWGAFIVEQTQEALRAYPGDEVEFTMYFPEAHLIPAVQTTLPPAAILAHLPPIVPPMQQKPWDVRQRS